jgi:hypothetical protein
MVGVVATAGSHIRSSFFLQKFCDFWEEKLKRPRDLIHPTVRVLLGFGKKSAGGCPGPLPPLLLSRGEKGASCLSSVGA